MKPLATFIVSVLSAGSLILPAATITTVGNAYPGIDRALNWSDSAVPSSGNDYVADGTGWLGIYSAGATFAGDSLTGKTIRFFVQQNGTYTIPDFRTATGATLDFWNTTAASPGNALDGSWTVNGTTDITTHSGMTVAQSFDINSDLYGRGQLRFGSQTDLQNDFTFGSSSASDWVGTVAMNLTGDQKMLLDFSNAHDLDRPTMGNLFIGSAGLNAPTAQLNWDQNFTFQNVDLSYAGGSVSLAKGYYNYADLQAIPVGAYTAADFFVDGGNFTLNIVAIPEPSAFGLLAIGAVVLRLRKAKFFQSAK